MIQQIDAARLAQMQRRYRAGEVIDFGLLKLSKEGVSQRNILLPRSQVKEIVLEEGYIRVRSKEGGTSPWPQISASYFSDVTKFMTLVREAINQPS